MDPEDFNHQQYRDTLAGKLKQEADKEKRREMLVKAQKTPEYQDAKIWHRANAEKRRQNLIEGGFIHEAEVFEKVVDFGKAVEAIGGRAMLVGGSVRDEIMGIPPKDYDIEVYNVEPDKLKELAATFGEVNEVGAAFGILKIRVGDTEIDVSLPRRESKIGQGHKDFAIDADPSMSVKEAARRRDFTINSLAKDILTGEIHDHFGGLADIQNRILRVTDEERFRDDPLRVLRGIQFVGRFGMKVDDASATIMREMRGELKHLPKERLREEWLKLFLRSRKPSLGLQTAMEWGIFHEMHPEIVELPNTPQEAEWHPEGDVWIHTLMVVDEAAKIIEQEQLKGKDAIIVMLAAFCHDLGKPPTTEIIDGRIRSRGHEPAGVEPTHKFLSEIGIEESLRNPIAKLVAEHLRPTMLYIQDVQKKERVTDGAIKRLATRISPANLKLLCLVSKADHLGRGPFVDPQEPEKSFMPMDYPAGDWLLEKATELGIYETKPEPVLFGRDLVALGFKPGPQFRILLQAADEAHVRGFTREEILTVIGTHNHLPINEITPILEAMQKS